MLIDSHCHLDFAAFDGDRQAVIERAVACGVTGILVPAIDLETSRNILDLAARCELVFAAVGVHPNSATTWTDDTPEQLRALARRPKVLAIGEIGLDYYRDRAAPELQQAVFESQLALAAELGLPVIVHTRNASPADRRATADALSILTAWRGDLKDAGKDLSERPGVLHSYSGDLASALQAIEQGFYIGISGPVTFRNAPELQVVVMGLPLERVLVETDAPFLTPHPHRGKRNEPAYIRLVADKIALIHNLEPEAVQQQTALNTQRLFNWRVNH
jgi:TatD DNase family protein